MPRVSQEHLDARRRQIIEAAWRCFAREGFHRTSMQDVIRESGLSAGAVYRYFRSKSELIQVAASEALAPARTTLDEILAEPDPVSPGAAVDRLLDRVLAFTIRPDLDLTRVAVTAWAETLRDDELHAVAKRVYGEVRARMVEVVRRWHEAGHLPGATDIEAAGQVVFSAVPGFLLQRLLLQDVDPHRYAAALGTLLDDPSPPGTRS